MNAQRDCIEKIRKLFGYNLTEELSAEVEEALTFNRGGWGRSLELLAGKLNSDTGHFFVELLQNADDASYPPDVLPTVSLEIWADTVMFSSNEIGFTEDNVRALCNVGMSTKKKNKKEQTGEKGIGFKSVFKISDRPEVHSNGFHFRFHRRRRPGGDYDDIGMVIPEWIEAPREGLPGAGTTVVLPLKSPDAFRFDLDRHVRPELLLFLRKVGRIVVVDHTRGERHELTSETHDRIVEVTHTTAQRGESRVARHRFFAYSAQLDMTGVDEPMRPDVTRTELTVGFPLGRV